jgi:AraC family transcriptional regulator
MKFIKVICLIGVVLFVFGCQKKAEEEPVEVVEKAEEPAEAPAEEAFSIEEVQAFNYVYLPVTGSYENYEEAVNNLMAAVQEQGVVPAGPMIGIYYNDPEVTPVEELSWEVGFQVEEGTEVQEPLMLKKWEFTKVVKAMHIGPYEETANMYPAIFKFMEDEGLTQTGPVMERFLDNPEEVAPEELKTEIWIPVE